MQKSWANMTSKTHDMLSTNKNLQYQDNLSYSNGDNIPLIWFHFNIKPNFDWTENI